MAHVDCIGEQNVAKNNSQWVHLLSSCASRGGKNIQMAGSAFVSLGQAGGLPMVKMGGVTTKTLIKQSEQYDW